MAQIMIAGGSEESINPTSINSCIRYNIEKHKNASNVNEKV